MDAKDYIVNEVLRDARRFIVPIYQRQYRWGLARLQPLWEDIVSKAEEVLRREVKFMHYMGALILSPTGDSDKFAITPSIQVVDGQQRITSFELFLAAIREIATELEIPDVDLSVREYLFNPPKSQDTDPTARFKLSPTPSDREMFWTLIERGRDGARSILPTAFFQKGSIKKGSAPPALLAYDYFLNQIRRYVAGGLGAVSEDEDGVDTSPTERVGALISAVLGRMKLVVITLGEADDAQVIFETLNSQAEPLLAMDLVRNNIFHRAERQGATVQQLYNELWQPFESPFWKAPAPRARPVRQRIEHFLAHALTAQTGSATSMRELYAEYRAFARPAGKERFPSVSDELKALIQFVAVYRDLEGEDDQDEDLAWLGRKLAAWEVTTAYPLVFRIAITAEAASLRRAMYRMIYSYIVRRAVCLLGAKNLNNVFQRAVATLIRGGSTLENLTGALADQSGPATRFPTDGEFEQAVLENAVYGRLNNPRLSDLLWELELASRSMEMEEVARPPNLWIEHVLPQTWSKHWPTEDGGELPRYSADPEVASVIQLRDRLKDTLGNLTLLTSSKNIQLGNQDFDTKKAKLKGHTLLALNHWILERASWTESDIEERGRHLAAYALKAWPYPAS
jgi:hypothetical protein